MISENTREILENALFEAGNVLISHFGNSHKAKVKESISSVVTEADLASERAILKVLGDTSNPFNVITEESGYIDQGSEFTWVVDPLDGTSNFAAGLPWFGVIIALMWKENPILAGMYLPVDQDLYLAESGKGAWKNGVPIETTPSPNLAEHLIAYSFDFNSDPLKTEAEMQLMARLTAHVRNIRSTNSLYDFCYVTDGRLGAAVNQATKIWDIAAPCLIIKEAGGMVTDINGDVIIFDLSPGSFDRNYTIVAAGAEIHQSIMKIIEPII
jgi:myo-inositol-1(or 4)-monophosphatase